MRAAPIRATAVPALQEDAIATKGTRRHERGSGLARQRREPTVAHHAAREGSYCASEMKGVDDLLELSLGVAIAQPLAAHDGLAFQQSDVAREQDSPFARGQRRQRRIVQIVAV